MKKISADFALAKKLPGHSQLERVRAARALINGRSGSEEMAFIAFMDIFHPEFSQDKVREVSRKIRFRERGY